MLSPEIHSVFESLVAQHIKAGVPREEAIRLARQQIEYKYGPQPRINVERLRQLKDTESPGGDTISGQVPIPFDDTQPDPTGLLQFQHYAGQNPIDRSDEGNQLALQRMAAGTHGSAPLMRMMGEMEYARGPGLQDRLSDIMSELLGKLEWSARPGANIDPAQAVEMLNSLQGLSGGLLAGDEARQTMGFREQMLGGPMTSDMVARYQMMNTGQAPYWYGEQLKQTETIKQVQDNLARLRERLSEPGIQNNPQMKRALEMKIRELEGYLNIMMGGGQPSRRQASAPAATGADWYRAQMNMGG